MKPRSLIIDIFADYVRHSGGEIRALTLTELAGRFGASEATTRMTLSRMRKEGWLESQREGRTSFYRATSKLTDLITRSEARILERREEPWTGVWDMVIYSIPETERVRRERLRSQLEWHGYGQFVAGCWVSPRRLNATLLEALDREGLADAGEIDAFESRSRGEEHDASIARRCWDIDDLQRAYGEFEDRHQRELSSLRSEGIDDTDAFTRRVELIAEYRKFPFRDPELPTELLPTDWTGRAAHATFLEMRELLRAPAFRYFENETRRHTDSASPVA